MLRRGWRAYRDGLENETNVAVTASSGVLWVVCPAAAAAWSAPSGAADIRLAFYEIAATIIPVLLLAYFVEHAAMTRSIARHSAITTDANRRKEGQRLLATGRALAALTASSAATGEILALYAVAHGSTSSFLYTGTVAALIATGMAILLFAIARIGQPPSY